MSEMMDQINAQMELLPPLVQYWMKGMSLIFIVSLAFVWKKKAARYAFASMLLVIPVGLLAFYFSNNVHLMGVGHLLFWTPLLYYLFKYEIKSDEFTFKSAYGGWVVLIMVTIAISLIFDVRDVILVATGAK